MTTPRPSRRSTAWPAIRPLPGPGPDAAGRRAREPEQARRRRRPVRQGRRGQQEPDRLGHGRAEVGLRPVRHRSPGSDRGQADAPDHRRPALSGAGARGHRHGPAWPPARAPPPRPTSSPSATPSTPPTPPAARPGGDRPDRLGHRRRPQKLEEAARTATPIPIQPPPGPAGPQAPDGAPIQVQPEAAQ
ncbi:MAG: hypothetical protein WDN45_10755 [Caulobacteraceae bacterium]